MNVLAAIFFGWLLIIVLCCVAYARIGEGGRATMTIPRFRRSSWTSRSPLIAVDTAGGGSGAMFGVMYATMVQEDEHIHVDVPRARKVNAWHDVEVGGGISLP